MSFSLEIGRWSRHTQQHADTVRRAVILKLFTAIIRDTPVLSGRLRGSWRCSVGHPDLSTLPEGSYGAQEAIGQVTSAAASSGKDSVVILSNALPYVHRIEYEGWSHTKAPAGMVRRNVSRFRQLVSKEVHTLT